MTNEVQPAPQNMGDLKQPLVHSPHTTGVQSGNPMLTHLGQVPEFFVRQRLDLIEVFTRWERKNKYYTYLNAADRDAKHNEQMRIKEESGCCMRMMWNPKHEFELKFKAPNDEVYLEAHRPCIWCYSTMFLKDAQTKRQIGVIDEECSNLWGCCSTKFTVKIGEGENPPPVFQVVGPSPCWVRTCMSCPCRDPFVYEAVKEGQNTGASVANIPNGCCKMCFTSADDYHVKFGSLSLEERALLFATTFLLDYAYFQAKEQNNNNSGY